MINKPGEAGRILDEFSQLSPLYAIGSVTIAIV